MTFFLLEALRNRWRGLQGYSEVCVFGIWRRILDLSLLDVAGKRGFYFVNTSVYIFGFSLGKHLNAAIRQVADKAGQLMSIGNPVGGEAKADALHLAGENYMLGGLVHIRISSFVVRVSYLERCITNHEIILQQSAMVCHINLRRFWVQGRAFLFMIFDSQNKPGYCKIK